MSKFSTLLIGGLVLMAGCGGQSGRNAPEPVLPPPGPPRVVAETEPAVVQPLHIVNPHAVQARRVNEVVWALTGTYKGDLRYVAFIDMPNAAMTESNFVQESGRMVPAHVHTLAGGGQFTVGSSWDGFRLLVNKQEYPLKDGAVFLCTVRNRELEVRQLPIAVSGKRPQLEAEIRQIIDIHPDVREFVAVVQSDRLVAPK